MWPSRSSRKLGTLSIKVFTERNEEIWLKFTDSNVILLSTVVWVPRVMWQAPRKTRISIWETLKRAYSEASSLYYVRMFVGMRTRSLWWKIKSVRSNKHVNRHNSLRHPVNWLLVGLFFPNKYIFEFVTSKSNLYGFTISIGFIMSALWRPDGNRWRLLMNSLSLFASECFVTLNCVCLVFCHLVTNDHSKIVEIFASS